MPRKWYAIIYPDEGSRTHYVHAFDNKGTRDAFVVSQEKRTSSAPASHPIVKRAIRYHGYGLPWPVSVTGGEQ